MRPSWMYYVDSFADSFPGEKTMPGPPTDHPGADPNHEAQVAAAKAAIQEFLQDPGKESAQKLKDAMDAIVWDS